MADEQQARDAEAALHLTNELLATVDVYIGRQPGGEMPVAVVADGVAGLAGAVAASGVEQLRAAGDTDGARMRRVACYRLVQRSLETLAKGDIEEEDGS